ncbi:MAG: hypothetical protein WCI27_07625, partial [Candidatus Omnitrophota bacterium]
QVLEFDKGHLTLSMQDIHSTLTGLLRLELKNDHQINWTLRLKTREIEHLKNFFFGIGVSKEYTQWQSSSSKGVAFFSAVRDSRLLQFSFLARKTVILLAKEKNNFPRIIFSLGCSNNIFSNVGSRHGRGTGLFKDDLKLLPDVESVFSGSVYFFDKDLKRR